MSPHHTHIHMHMLCSKQNLSTSHTHIHMLCSKQNAYKCTYLMELISLSIKQISFFRNFKNVKPKKGTFTQ